MEYLGLCLLLSALMLLKAENLARYSVRKLIELYQEHKENALAFELLNRYRHVSNGEKGEILWGLLAPHTDDLARIAASMGEDPAEELQKLYLKLHALFVREKFPHSNWKYWLARILKNDLLNQKKRKNPLVSVPVEMLGEVEEEQGRAELSEEKLQAAIKQLPENQQKVVELRYLRRKEKLMTYKEIAQIMNCSVGQVHGYLDRAKENLRTLLAAEISDITS